MFLKSSRYETVPLFEPDPDGRTAFQGVKPRSIPITQGVLEHGQTASDRPDLLAQDYYQADRAWYRILDANVEYVVAGPIRDAQDARVSGGDGLPPEANEGDVMLSDAGQGGALLIPARKG